MLAKGIIMMMNKTTLLALTIAAFTTTAFANDEAMMGTPNSGLQAGVYLSQHSFDINYSGTVNEGAGDVAASYELDGDVTALGLKGIYNAEAGDFEVYYETGISDSFDALKTKNCLTGCDGAGASPDVDYSRFGAKFMTDQSHWFEQMDQTFRIGAEFISTSLDTGSHPAKNLDSYSSEVKTSEIGAVAEWKFHSDPKLTWEIEGGLYYTDGSIKGSGSFDAGVVVVNESNEYEFSAVTAKLRGGVSYAFNDRVLAYAGVEWSDNVVDIDDTLKHNVSLVNGASGNAGSVEYGELSIESGVTMKF